MDGGRVAVVVLAGGEGRRLEGGKPQRLLGGRPLLGRALERARTYSDRIALSLRAEGQVPAPQGVELVLDDAAIPGPLAGIAAALDFASRAGAEAVLTLPVDAPFLPDDLLVRLADTLEGGAGAAVAASGGRLHPACGLWRAGLRPQLDAYRATGRASLTGFAQAVGAVEVVWPAEPLDPFFNVNTPVDLAEAEALLAARRPANA